MVSKIIKTSQAATANIVHKRIASEIVVDFSSQDKEHLFNPKGRTISYAATKDVNNEIVYDFYDSNGTLLYSSMIRLKNNCYPSSLEFYFFKKNHTLFYISKEKQQELLECEEAIPLNDDYVAYKRHGCPYWGVLNKNGVIKLKDTRCGQIFGITAEENILCLTTLNKIGLFSLKDLKVIQDLPYGDSSKIILMHPETNFVCINKELMFHTYKCYNIKQILSKNFLLSLNNRIYDCTSGQPIDKYCGLSGEHLQGDNYFIWNEYETYFPKVGSKRFVYLVASQGDFYIFRENQGMGLFDVSRDSDRVTNKLKMFFIVDSKLVIFQEGDFSVGLYDVVDESVQKFDTNYELYSVAMKYDQLWIVTRYNQETFCCYLFSLDGTEIIGDRFSQYGFFAPYNKNSIIYAKDDALYTIEFNVETETRVEKVLKKSAQKYDATTMVLPKMNTFVIIYNDMWDLIDINGKCLIESNKEYRIVQEKDNLMAFINSNLLLVQKKAETEEEELKSFGAYNLNGKLVIPCEYNRIERW